MGQLPPQVSSPYTGTVLTSGQRGCHPGLHREGPGRFPGWSGVRLLVSCQETLWGTTHPTPALDPATGASEGRCWAGCRHLCAHLCLTAIAALIGLTSSSCPRAHLACP